MEKIKFELQQLNGETVLVSNHIELSDFCKRVALYTQFETGESLKLSEVTGDTVVLMINKDNSLTIKDASGITKIILFVKEL